MIQNILLGVTGSIAAYKSAELVRTLIKAGFNVKIIMTNSATDFITPLTLSVLSKNEVHTDLIKDDKWVNHVELAEWADLFLIAPMSANTIAKFINKYIDDLLSAVYASSKCPVWIAPAMDSEMYKKCLNSEMVRKLNTQNIKILNSPKGELASGLIGHGRMMEPDNIVSKILKYQKYSKRFEGQRMLITAGSTREFIDPIRFISNPASGRTGVEIAKKAAEQGASITLIIGEHNLEYSELSIPSSQLNVVSVTTAEEMYIQAKKYHPASNISIFTAAVGDYTPVQQKNHKIKKNGADLIIELKRTKDIALKLGKNKRSKQIHVGFKAETEKLTDTNLNRVLDKLVEKNFNMLVYNFINSDNPGFGQSENKVSLIKQDKKIEHLEKMPKSDLSDVIFDNIAEMIIKD